MRRQKSVLRRYKHNTKG